MQKEITSVKISGLLAFMIYELKRFQ